MPGISDRDLTSEGWQPPVYIITGEQGEGKTTFLLEIISVLTEKGIKIRGIAAPGYFKNGFRSGFSVIDLATGMSEDLCSVDPSSESIQYGRYYFRMEGISFGCRALVFDQSDSQTDLLVIDEVGKFEMEGSVWAECIDDIISKTCPPMIWTVRSSLVDAVTEKWRIARRIVLKVGSVSNSEIISDILEEIRIYRSYAR